MYKKPHDLSDGLLSSLILEDPDKDGVDLLPSPCKQIVSVVDDLWCMGEHRLLCGDSTNSTAAARIMGSERAHLLFTSPPYGNQRNYATGGIGDWDALMRGVFGRLDEVMVQDGQVLVNLGLVHRDNEWLPYWQGWLDWMRGEGWRSFGLYVWDQGQAYLAIGTAASRRHLNSSFTSTSMRANQTRSSPARRQARSAMRPAPPACG